MRKPSPPNMEAMGAYDKAHQVAQDLLKVIGERLQNMPPSDGDDKSIHWGHVGDIRHVNELLSEIACFLPAGGESVV